MNNDIQAVADHNQVPFRIGSLIQNQFLPDDIYHIRSIELKYFPNVEEPEIYFMASPVMIDNNGDLHHLESIKVSAVGSSHITREDLVNWMLRVTEKYDAQIAGIKQLIDEIEG